MQVSEDAIIRGKRQLSGVLVTVEQSGYIQSLPHCVHHSPTGFEWGYPGSGPADLALSILDYCIEDGGRRTPIWKGTVKRLAYTLHQDFKEEFVARWPRDSWVITVGQVRAWVEKNAEGLR